MELISITDREFKLFRNLIYDEVGINLTEAKKPLLVSRLTRRFLELNIRSFSEYYGIVSIDRAELVRLLDSISTNKTEFFRESGHFDFLAGRFLRDMQSKAHREGIKKIRIWSSACSTGEEPYSIVISLMEGLSMDRYWDIKVLASDICTKVLETAQKGVYDNQSIKKVPSHLWNRYFLKGVDDNTGKYKIKGFVREKVIFRRLNLKDREWPIRCAFDAIFCRNVLIYFDRYTRIDTIRKLARYLSPGGYLFLGHAESVPEGLEGFVKVAHSIYQKV